MNVNTNVKHIRIVLPFRLPTWNQLLAMNRWQRKKVRDWIKGAVSTCIREGIVSQTQTELVARLSWTDLLKLEYLKMIQPDSSKRYRFRKKLEKMRQ